jgi:hypothetical protein
VCSCGAPPQQLTGLNSFQRIIISVIAKNEAARHHMQTAAPALYALTKRCSDCCWASRSSSPSRLQRCRRQRQHHRLRIHLAFDAPRQAHRQ